MREQHPENHREGDSTNDPELQEDAWLGEEAANYPHAPAGVTANLGGNGGFPPMNAPYKEGISRLLHFIAFGFLWSSSVQAKGIFTTAILGIAGFVAASFNAIGIGLIFISLLLANLFLVSYVQGSINNRYSVHPTLLTMGFLGFVIIAIASLVATIEFAS